jgi:hypothetical protein
MLQHKLFQNFKDAFLFGILPLCLFIKFFAFSLAFQISPPSIGHFGFLLVRALFVGLVLSLLIDLSWRKFPGRSRPILIMLGIISGLVMMAYSTFVASLKDYPFFPGSLFASGEGFDFFISSPSIIFQGPWPLFFIDILAFFLFRPLQPLLPLSATNRIRLFGGCAILVLLVAVEAQNLRVNAAITNGTIFENERSTVIKRYGAVALAIMDVLDSGRPPNAVHFSKGYTSIIYL